jgi:hypothetical protein
MSKNSPKRLYCFSPEVMMVTFVIESVSALYVLFKYKTTRAAQIIISIIGFLALFQFAEFMICEQTFFLTSLDWARVGYVAITILPPLAMHLGLTIAKKKHTVLLMTAYGSAAIFSIFFLFIGHGIESQQCLGNYVIFSVAPYISVPYGLYYHGWLAVGIALSLRAYMHIKETQQKKALLWLVVGYLSFILPTIVVNLLDHATLAGIPSIMCGFAIIMALTLVLKVAPLILKKK